MKHIADAQRTVLWLGAGGARDNARGWRLAREAAKYALFREGFLASTSEKAIRTRVVWTNQIFSAAAVGNGGVVRRAVADVRQFGSVKLLKREARRR